MAFGLQEGLRDARRRGNREPHADSRGDGHTRFGKSH